jgi:hypothetical protein
VEVINQKVKGRTPDISYPASHRTFFWPNVGETLEKSLRQLPMKSSYWNQYHFKKAPTW